MAASGNVAFARPCIRNKTSYSTSSSTSCFTLDNWGEYKATRALMP